MARTRLTEKVHEWPNGFAVVADSKHTVLALIVGGGLIDSFSLNVSASFPQDTSRKWSAARNLYRKATYIETRYASGIVMDFTKQFTNNASDPIRCLYESKNPKARHVMQRTGKDASELVLEIANFQWK